MTSRSPAEILAASRRETSLRKRQRVLDTVQRMLNDGAPITFTAVARAARVSNWLVYAEGVREHVETAIQRQERAPVPTHDVSQASTAGLKADLTMAREEIKALRNERDRLREGLQQQLGNQLDQINNRQLTERISELTDANRRLEREVTQLRPLQNQVRRLQNDLDAARTSLRQIIRAQNRIDPSD